MSTIGGGTNSRGPFGKKPQMETSNDARNTGYSPNTSREDNGYGRNNYSNNDSGYNNSSRGGGGGGYDHQRRSNDYQSRGPLNTFSKRQDNRIFGDEDDQRESRNSSNDQRGNGYQQNGGSFSNGGNYNNGGGYQQSRGGGYHNDSQDNDHRGGGGGRGGGFQSRDNHNGYQQDNKMRSGGYDNFQNNDRNFQRNNDNNYERGGGSGFQRGFGSRGGRPGGGGEHHDRNDYGRRDDGPPQRNNDFNRGGYQNGQENGRGGWGGGWGKSDGGDRSGGRGGGRDEGFHGNSNAFNRSNDGPSDYKKEFRNTGGMMDDDNGGSFGGRRNFDSNRGSFNDRGGRSRGGGGRGGGSFGDFGGSSRDDSFGGGNMEFVQGGGEDRAPRGWAPDITAADDLFQRDRDVVNEYDDDYADDPVTVTGDGAKQYMLDSWQESGLNDVIIHKIVEQSGFKKVRPIQAACIPQILDNKDVVGHCETGGGKTLAFVAPIVHRLLECPAAQPCSPYALVIAPTRELATQNYEAFFKMIQGTRLKAVLCFGQIDKRTILTGFHEGCEIVVGTPGRLMDFAEKGDLCLQNLKFLVLDEADNLIKDRDHLQTLLRNKEFLASNANRQNLLFSATVPDFFQRMAKDILRDNYVTISNGNSSKANKRVEQIYVETQGKPDKNRALLEYISKKDASKTLIFVQKKMDTDFIGSYLAQKGIAAESINGDRPQNLRSEIFDRFKKGKTTILVGTDVCARGHDVQGLDVVINFDLPECTHNSTEQALDTFVHRIGRTGRTKRGKAITFVDPNRDDSFAKCLVKVCKDSAQQPPPFLEQLANGGGGSFKRSFKSFGFDDDDDKPRKPAPFESGKGFGSFGGSGGFAKENNDNSGSGGFGSFKPPSGSAFSDDEGDAKVDEANSEFGNIKISGKQGFGNERSPSPAHSDKSGDTLNGGW